jgi:hypothetical protein
MDTPTLFCSSKKVINFYNEHTNLDFTVMNDIFTDIMINLYQNMNSSLTNNIAHQLLSNIQGLQAQLTAVSDNVNKLQNDTLINFSSKFSDFRREYIEDVKMILSNNTTEKITPLIKEYNGIMLDKTFIMINDIVPKNNENLTKQINDSMKQFHNSISEDTNKLLKSTLNQKSFDDFLCNLDGKFSTTLSNSQQIINSMITSSEQRLDTRIGEIKNSTENHIFDIKSLSATNQTSQTSLHNDVNELLKKMDVSSSKGKCSENIIFNILHSLYPQAQIDFVGEHKETGDIMLTRKNKPTILIENKNWNKNVVQEEVKKFIRDVETQKCCGLFLAQNYGIANKENFEINIHNTNVLLYVHETNNDAEKIKIAIDVIDNFKMKIDELVATTGEGYSIDTDILDDINREYQTFASHKMAQIKTVKDFTQKMIKQIEDIQLPTLEAYLSTRYAFSSSKYVCEYCDYVAKNQSGMSAHKRYCKKRTDSSLFCEEIETPEIIMTEPIQNIVINQPKPAKTKNTKTINASK